MAKCLQVFRWCGNKGMQDDPGDKFSRHWSPVLLNTLQIFTLPQTGSSYRGRCLSITLQRWLIMLAGWCMLLGKKASSTYYAPPTQWPSPTLGAKCVTVVQSTVPRYTGQFNQPLMLGLVSWVWLGIHAGDYLSTDDTERSNF